MDKCNITQNTMNSDATQVDENTSHVETNIMNDQILEPVDPDDSVINRLVMCSYVECMLCGNVNKEGQNLMTLGNYLSGWYYCDECLNSQRLLRAVYGFIVSQDIIPMWWLFGSNIKSLKFFRFSKKDTDQPIYEGFLSTDDIVSNNLIFNEKYNLYRIPLRFKDNHGDQENLDNQEYPENSQNPDDQMLYRSVSLQNLFAHNPILYKELTESEDLMNLNNPMIKISYRQLPGSIRAKIEEAYELSKSESKIFMY
jgi:hypothetical protein